MRPLFLILLLPATNYAQLSGIGPFRIGLCKTQIIDSIAKNHGKPVIESASSYDCSSYGTFGTSKIIKVIENSDPEYRAGNDEYSYVKDVVVYYIDHISVSGIEFSDIYLKFFRDTLFMFQSNNNPDIETALTLKYGKPIIVDKKLRVTCRNGLGITFEQEGYVTKYRWMSKPGIRSKFIYSLYYNDKCEKTVGGSFTLAKATLYDYVVKKDKQLADKREMEKLKQVKQKLSDL